MYYKDWKQDVIIDRGMWGSPNNFNFLKKYVNPKPKIILLVRYVLEVLASFIDWSNNNKNAFIFNKLVTSPTTKAFLNKTFDSSALDDFFEIKKLIPR